MPVRLPTGQCGDLAPATPAAAKHDGQGSAGLAALRDPRRVPYFDSIALSRGAALVLIGGHTATLRKNLRVATSSPIVVIILMANTIVRRLYRLW